MSRPRSSGHHETRGRILDAARTLVLKDGFEKLSLRAVARRAGFGPASLYEYFDGKDAIVEALARDAAASLRSALLEASSAGRPSRAWLVNLGRAYVRWARARPEDFLLLFSRLPSTRRSTQQPTPESSPFAVVVAAVNRAASAGVLPAGKKSGPEDVAYALWALAHGTAMLQLTHLSGFDADFDAADEAAFEALVAGLAR